MPLGVANKYGAYEVEFHATRLGGISAYSLGSGSQVMNESSSGFYYPEHPSLTGQLPVGSFTTLQIARALGLCGLTGTSIDGLASGLKYYLRKHAEGSTRTAGSAHHKYTIRGGLVYPATLTCDHQGNATLTYNVIVTYDGTNVPIVLTTSQALPAVQSDDEQFTLGTFKIGNVDFTAIKSMSLNFGINAVSEGADSEIWDRYVSIEDIKPSLTLTGIDPDWFAAAAIPLLGLKGTKAQTIFYLRKRAIGGTSWVADGTSEHIKFEGANLATVDDMIQVTGQDASGITINVPFYYDGTNAPLVIDTTSAIT